MIEFWSYLTQRYHWRLAVRVIALAVTIAVLIGLFVMAVARPARADIPGFGQGCETVHWGPFGGQRRTICDGAKNPDGSWLREREVWVPAADVQGWCYGWTCTSSYRRDRSTVTYEQYLVTPATVLADEPAWLPPGTVRIL